MGIPAGIRLLIIELNVPPIANASIPINMNPNKRHSIQVIATNIPVNELDDTPSSSRDNPTFLSYKYLRATSNSS